jgi:hydrogenase nickel incorporation protein HypA/HybF
MHEISIAHNIHRIVREKIKEMYGKTIPVKKVKMVIGKMSNVVPEALDFALELVSKDTEFENAEYEIDYRPLKVKCKDCKEEMILDEPFMFCRKCESFNIEIISGRELYVDSFEIDDDINPDCPES